jgi:hypothetical protein
MTLETVITFTTKNKILRRILIMAVATNRGNDNQRDKINWKWGNSGPNFWQRDNKTLLQAALRKADTYNNYELILKIQALDDNGKFVKNEEGNYENGYFNLSYNEIAKVAYQLEQMFPTGNMDAGNIGGIIINHISSQSNSGSQLEIVSEEEGVFIYISYVTSGKVVSEYKHLLSNDQSLKFYNEEGEEAEEVVNMDIISLKTLFNSAYALVSGLVDSAFECNGISINGRSESRSGGHIAGGVKRQIRSTLGSKRAESVSEDDDAEDAAPVAKKTVGRKPASSIAKSASNMKSLLEDDEEEEDD